MTAVLSVIEKLPGESARKDCIKLLEDTLASAQAGEIVTVAIAALKADGTGTTAFSETSHALALIGVSHCLMNRLEKGMQE